MPKPYEQIIREIKPMLLPDGMKRLREIEETYRFYRDRRDDEQRRKTG